MKYLISFLAWLIKLAVTLFWICDVCDMPFMAQFDTTYPLNSLFWFLVWVFCSGFAPTVYHKIERKQ